MKLVLFDLDGTLIPKDSDHAFGEFVIELGWADATEFRERNDAFYADYQHGRLDMAAYVDFATRPWREKPEAELQRALAAFVDRVVQPTVTPAALALVDRHRREGARLAVVTATNEVVTRPIVALFGVETLIATELVRDGRGRVTGAIAGTPAFREGKVARVAQWLAREGSSIQAFGSSSFYSDSANDLPLLEAVTHPVATNPGAALERVARERGWPVLRLFEP